MLNFEEVKEEKIRFFEQHHTIVLATSLGDKVTARTVSYATEGIDFYILSWNHHEKVLQIEQNPNVALARDNISMKGVAEILGRPLDEKSRIGAEVIKKKRPKEFEIFSRISGMIIMKITPKYIKSWVRINNKFFIEHLDIENKRVCLQKPED